MRIERLSAIIALCMIAISSLSASSQEGVIVRIESREDPCIAGFPCELRVFILNEDGIALLSKLKLITPWGSFVKELGLRELKGGESIRVPITINVSIDSLEGPNFVRPELMYYLKGKIGIYYSAGNSSAVLVQRPKVSATLLASPLSYTLALGEPLILEGSYEVEGVPKDFNPSITVSVDGSPVIKKSMNSTRGVFSITVPIGTAGIHEVNLSLCYSLDCVSRKFSVVVGEAHAGYSKSDLLRDLNSTRRELQDLVTLYKEAVNDAIPIPSSVLQNITAVDSLLAEAEAKLSGNLTFDKAERARELLNRASDLISGTSRSILESYRRAVLSGVHDLREELNALAGVDEGAYRNFSYKLDSIEERVASISKDDAPSVYRESMKEIKEIREAIEFRREKLSRDATALALAVISLMTISMISTAMLILRKWRRSLKGERS